MNFRVVSTEKAVSGLGVGHVDPAVCEIGFQVDGIVTVAKVHTKSDEDSTGRCSPVSLALGSVLLCFNHSVKIQILVYIEVINFSVSLLARLCKRPNKIP